MIEFDFKKFQDQLEKSGKKLDDVKKYIEAESSRLAMQTGLIVVDEAKDKIVELKHVVTGTLLRSIKNKLEQVTQREANTLVGSEVHYAVYVESLPDGGYLWSSLVRKWADVQKFFVVGIRSIIDEALKS